ncbi:DUF6970 domain-containing protein [Pseudomonas asuensis]
MKNAWIVMLAVMMGCSKAPPSAEPADIPVWLQTRIKSLQALPEANPPRSISKTIFEGETAYYVSPACCDIPSELYKADGRLRCYPSGGIAGAMAVALRLVWIGSAWSLFGEMNAPPEIKALLYRNDPASARVKQCLQNRALYARSCYQWLGNAV